MAPFSRMRADSKGHWDNKAGFVGVFFLAIMSDYN